MRRFFLISLFNLAYCVASPLHVGQFQVASPSPSALVSPDYIQVPFRIMPPPPSSSRKPLQGPLVMAYYPDWVGNEFPPEKIDFRRFDWIDFAFALPMSDFTLAFDDPDNAPALLRRLVSAAHAKGKQVKLSVGGWTGSQYFSNAVNCTNNRQTFANNILSLYHQYSLDGIDIDWEYPGRQGAGGNVVNPNDSNNFLLFLQLLRNKLPPNARISAAVLPTPFFGPDGNPMQDVSRFAQVLDWVTVMNYDVWGCNVFQSWPKRALVRRL
ncbi:MPN domain-containing protein [Mycena chlorophos]|uniref:MPN domain-containing protein n=1 Tax=Mycena chlorophos TaxID=658473 RepID=A0A8H6S403_MYCCL|nr:MPN domain-containing protein [Mycena chlorophos]